MFKTYSDDLEGKKKIGKGTGGKTEIRYETNYSHI